MMKRLVLLLLLTSWSHLGSEARNCDTSISMPSFILHLDGSAQAKADISFTHGYTSNNLTTCLEDCCSAAYGPCSVATYKNQSAETNCLHFYCWPLRQCKFLPTTFGDTFTFPGAKSGIHGLDNNIATHSVQQIKGHARSVAARKGAENVAVSRKGVLAESSSLKSGLSEEIPDTSTLFLESDYAYSDNATSTSKIKARKGVESLTESIITPTTTVAIQDKQSLISEFVHSVNSTSDLNATDSELVSLIRHVFQEELYINNTDNEVPYNLTLPFHIDNISTSTNPLPFSSDVVTLDTHALSSSFNLEQSRETYNSATPRTSIDKSTFDDALGSTKHIISTYRFSEPSSSSTRGQILISQRTNNLWHSTKDITTTTSAMILASTVHSTGTYLTVGTHDTGGASIISTTTSASTSSATKRLANDRLESVVTETENERRYKSSMHLVISLVIGLLVLLTVMGVVAKRVYDLWLRRHYSRMDFLIDGLYDGYS